MLHKRCINRYNCTYRACAKSLLVCHGTCFVFRYDIYKTRANSKTGKSNSGKMKLIPRCVFCCCCCCYSKRPIDLAFLARCTNKKKCAANVRYDASKVYGQLMGMRAQMLHTAVIFILNRRKLMSSRVW